MRAVESNYGGLRASPCGKSVTVNRVIQLAKDVGHKECVVRLENGQLCTFKRKSPPQGGEG